jgi:hypothetical protein
MLIRTILRDLIKYILVKERKEGLGWAFSYFYGDLKLILKCNFFKI